MISLKSNKIKALAAGLMLTLALGALGCGGDISVFNVYLLYKKLHVLL